MDETEEEAATECYNSQRPQQLCTVENARRLAWIRGHKCLYHLYDPLNGDCPPLGGVSQYYLKCYPGSFNDSWFVGCPKCGEEVDITHWEHA